MSFLQQLWMINYDMNNYRLVIVATYPSAGGRHETRGMRVPRKESARSRHQRLFEENVGKTEGNRSKRKF